MAIEIECWKHLIEQLPGIYNAQIFCKEGGVVSEIHILADQSRSPKQIMRDVQSAITAKYEEKIDHKIISIAQIPALDTMGTQQPRLKYTGLSMSFTNTECKITVSLESKGIKFVSSAVCDLYKANRYRTIALATVKAVNEYLKNSANIALKEIKITQVDTNTVVISSVLFNHKGTSEVLVGACVEKDDSGPAAVRATLDAVNRRLSII